jgi:hypothetical protein
MRVLSIVGLVAIVGPAAAQFEPPPDWPDWRIGDRAIIRRHAEAGLVFSAQTLEEATLPSDEALARVEVAPDLLEIVSRLDAPKWSQRESAAHELESHSAPLDQLLAVLNREALSVEQRSRLVEVVNQRILHAPRGAMGIRMQLGFEGRGGVTVQDLLNGMPAEGILKVHDRIIEIDGREVGTAGDLAEIVQMRRPGDVIRVVVMRPARGPNGEILYDEKHQRIEERIVASMPLASQDDLEKFEAGDVPPMPGFPRVATRTRDQLAILRSMQARELSLRFGVRPVAVEEEPSAENASDGSAPRAAAGDKSREVHTHPALEQLVHELAYVRSGAMKITEPLRRTWLLRRDDLQRQVSDVNLSRDDRAYLARVLDEYTRLMHAAAE